MSNIHFQPRQTQNSQRAGFVDTVLSLTQPIAGPSTYGVLPSTPSILEGSYPRFPTETPIHAPVLSQPPLPMGSTIGGSNSSHGEHNPFVTPNVTDDAAERFPVMEEPTTANQIPLSPIEESTDEEFTPNIPSQSRLVNILDEISNRLSQTTIPPAPPQMSSRAKPRAPDTFDGSDPSKLDSFILQCSLYIALRSSDFPDESAKVSFILSYLKGSPLDWFQTDLINGSATWFHSTQFFLQELRRLFGSQDPIADATIALENLRYRDSGKAIKYTLDFNRHALRTGWNNVALVRQYYKGLPDRLKDEVTRFGRPNTLPELQQTIQILDQRYWERQNEISRDRRITTPQTPGFRSSDKSSASSSSPPAAKPQSSSSNSFSSKPPQRPPNSAPTIADKLGKDGKLREEERKHRIANKLCLFCGLAGHAIRECRKRLASDKKNAVKGRAAEVSELTPSKELKE